MGEVGSNYLTTEDISLKILVTGDREWTNKAIIKSALIGSIPLVIHLRYGLPLDRCLKLSKEIIGCQITLIHGAARGADTLAAIAAQELGFNTDPHPADWKHHGRAAGPIRNNKMLALVPDFVIAFHNNIEQSKGTKHCLQSAKKLEYPSALITEASYTNMATYVTEHPDEFPSLRHVINRT